MKIGVMQPYFFPYLGYWQLMNAVDTYVILDDVNYIKRGWINRNRIKNSRDEVRMILPVHKASQNRYINQHEIIRDDKNYEKLRAQIQLAYKKAPHFEEVYALFDDVLNQEEDNLSAYLTYSIQKIAAYLGMDTRFVLSSELDKNMEFRGQDKILEICEILGGDTYYNAIGGVELYDKALFASHGISLSFLSMNDDIVYPQGSGEFIPGLSILDVMMYNSSEECRELLKRYTLI